MVSQIICECGYVARAADDEGVIDLIQEHLRTDHPAMAESTTRDDIRRWIELVD